MNQKTYLARLLINNTVVATGVAVEKVGTTLLRVRSVPTSFQFPNATNFYDPLTIKWEINDGSGYVSAGTSANPVYVFLGPIGTIKPFYTTVSLACTTSGAVDSATAVANTWDLVKGLSVSAWKKQPNGSYAQTRRLYYYLAGTPFAANPFAFKASALLRSTNDSAQCFPWAALLKDAFDLNGVTTQATIITPINADRFFVREWEFIGPGDQGKWVAIFANKADEMVPPPGIPATDYGALRNKPGLSGQGVSVGQQQTPSEKVFERHAGVRVGSKVYDICYGKVWESEAQFKADAVAAFGLTVTGEPKKLNVFQPSESFGIKFTP